MTNKKSYEETDTRFELFMAELPRIHVNIFEQLKNDCKNDAKMLCKNAHAGPEGVKAVYRHI